MFPVHLFTKKERSSLSQMYFKEGIFKNFTNFSRKHLHWEITYNFMKKRAPFLTKRLHWLLLKGRRKGGREEKFK